MSEQLPQLNADDILSALVKQINYLAKVSTYTTQEGKQQLTDDRVNEALEELIFYFLNQKDILKLGAIALGALMTADTDAKGKIILKDDETRPDVAEKILDDLEERQAPVSAETMNAVKKLLRGNDSAEQ